MKMKKLMFGLLMLALTALAITGCGSSSGGTNVSGVATLKAAQPEFPNSMLLVSPESLQASLGAKKLVVIDTRASAAYTAGHIPGAINVNWQDYRDSAAMALKPTATLESQLSTAGISRDATIVIYDDTVYSFGSAGRIFWMLDYLGCDDIHLLNGGWDKWKADNRTIQTETPKPQVATFTAATLRTDISAKKSHIMNRLGDRDFVVLDTRTDEEYLGWQLHGEARPGHITGSVNIPYAWYYNADRTVLGYDKLKAMFESRGITGEKEVVAHCTSGIRSAHAYFLLRLMGYARCANYDGSIKEWAATTPQLPMEYAANYKRLVYAGWVKSLIDGGTPATFPAGNSYKIFECSWGPMAYADTYKSGHIKGAIHFDTNNVEARNYLDPTNPFPVSDANEIVWDLVSDSLLQARLAALGVSNSTTVIVYGEDATATARAYWALRYAGVDVRYLNGGLEDWTFNFGKTSLETDINTPAPASFTINPQNQFKALTGPDIKPYVDFFRASGNTARQPGTVLVDVRGLQEYTGEIKFYNDPVLTRKGRIPGAVWGYNADSSSSDFMDADRTLRSYTEVRDRWAAKGITPDKTVIFYCGTGWRSTLAFLYADVMGWQNIKNYDSWYVWSTFYEQATDTIHRNAPFNDPSTQIDTGWPSP